MIVVGTKIKGKGPTGWTGTVVAIGAPPKGCQTLGYRPKMMPRYADDSGETVWIDWGSNILCDDIRVRVLYGYPMSTAEKLEVVKP